MVCVDVIYYFHGDKHFFYGFFCEVYYFGECVYVTLIGETIFICQVVVLTEGGGFLYHGPKCLCFVAYVVYLFYCLFGFGKHYFLV